MADELQKLRIDKSQKARRDEKAVWPWALLVLLIGGGAFGAWRWTEATGAPVVRTMRVRLPEGMVADTDLVMLNATGYIMASHKIELASKVVGRVAWVGVEMGDKIKVGQELVRLEDDEYKARVAQEQGQLDAAKAKLDELVAGSRPEEIAEMNAAVDEMKSDLGNAESNLTRLRGLSEAGNVSKQELIDAESLVQSRKAKVDAAQQRYQMMKIGPRKEQIAAQRATVQQLEGGLALAMVDLRNTVIRSQVDATVLERNVEVGEFVTTGFVGDRGAKGYVVSIADLNDLRVELDISQNDFAKVRPKQPCWITTDAYPDRRYEGVVDLISPEANRQKATVEVRVKVLQPDELLKPDMNATVSFLSPAKLAAIKNAPATQSTEKPALRVPESAVREGKVFVVEKARAQAKAVTTGLTTASKEIEIHKGLIGGEDLITNPPADLKDGDAVKVQP